MGVDQFLKLSDQERIIALKSEEGLVILAKMLSHLEKTTSNAVLTKNLPVLFEALDMVNIMEDLSKNKELSDLFKHLGRSIELWQNSCIQGIAVVLHSRGTDFLGQKNYREAADCHRDVLTFISSYPKYFNLSAEFIRNFIDEISSSYAAGNKNDPLPFEEVKKNRILFLNKAKEIAKDETQRVFLGIIVEALTTQVIGAYAAKKA